MREIKFRAYFRNQIWNVETLYFVDDFIELRNPITKKGEGVDGIEKVNLMQFTGLTDKNGKEIYEGDIVKIDEDNYCSEKKGIVAFEKGTCLLHRSIETTKYGYYEKVNIWDDSIPDCYSLGLVEKDNIEVIGNIYEKSELMK